MFVESDSRGYDNFIIAVHNKSGVSTEGLSRFFLWSKHKPLLN
jgi:hypothetical protein